MIMGVEGITEPILTWSSGLLFLAGTVLSLVIYFLSKRKKKQEESRLDLLREIHSKSSGFEIDYEETFFDFDGIATFGNHSFLPVLNKHLERYTEEGVPELAEEILAALHRFESEHSVKITNWGKQICYQRVAGLWITHEPKTVNQVMTERYDESLCDPCLAHIREDSGAPAD